MRITQARDNGRMWDSCQRHCCMLERIPVNANKNYVGTKSCCAKLQPQAIKL